MQVGKLKNDVLETLVLGKIKTIRDDVILGPGVGEDCAAVSFGDYACVLTTDPITGSGSNLGKLAVHVCVNDIASSGSEPVALMLTLLCPVGTEKEEIQAILEEANATANALGVEIVGGHTEITDAVNKMVVSATAVGRVAKQKLIKTGGGQVGDYLYMTKYPGLEGTAIIAHDKEETLLEALPREIVENGKKWIDHISVLEEGRIGALVGVSAMHDATEGGVLGAIHELCEASGLGCRLYHGKLEVLEETERICSFFNINPLKLISSGVMIFAVSKEKATALEKAFLDKDIHYSKVGELTEDKKCLLVYGTNAVDEIVEPIEMPESDELYKVI